MSYLRPGHFDLIAHRGGALVGAENTLEAFAQALKLNPDFIFETDVHRTKDGIVVCIHDDTLERTTNGKGFVWDYTWDELRNLDAAYNFTMDGGKTFPWRGKGISIPKLEDVFKTFPHSRVSIEAKHANPFFGKDIATIINDCKAGDRVVIAGEKHPILQEFRGHASQLCSGYSAKEVLRFYIFTRAHLPYFLPRRGDVLQVPYRHGALTVVTERFVKYAHKAGKAVHVWTINDEATMRHLIQIGVDGIMTDAPSLLLRVAQELKTF